MSPQNLPSLCPLCNYLPVFPLSTYISVTAISQWGERKDLFYRLILSGIFFLLSRTAGGHSPVTTITLLWGDCGNTPTLWDKLSLSSNCILRFDLCTLQRQHLGNKQSSCLSCFSFHFSPCITIDQFDFWFWFWLNVSLCSVPCHICHQPNIHSEQWSKDELWRDQRF